MPGTLLYLIILLPYSDQLFSPDTFIEHRPFDPENWAHWFERLVVHPEVHPYYHWFLVGEFLSLICALLNRYTRLAMLGVCFFSLNLFNLCGPISSGGTNLASVLFVYMVFVDTSGRKYTSRDTFGSLIKVTLSNVAYIICLIQIVFVYACAGMYKVPESVANGHGSLLHFAT